MKDNIFSILIAAAVICFSAAIVVFSLSGCAHYPDLQDFSVGTSNTCIRYERCLYYSAKSRKKLDCSVLEAACAKADIFLDYYTAQEQMPLVYDKSGEHKMTFQEYWDKRN